MSLNARKAVAKCEQAEPYIDEAENVFLRRILQAAGAFALATAYFLLLAFGVLRFAHGDRVKDVKVNADAV